MLRMSVEELDTNLLANWTGVMAADALEMRIAGDTRGRLHTVDDRNHACVQLRIIPAVQSVERPGSTRRPGPEYFPRLPQRAAADDIWRDRGAQLITDCFRKPLEVADAVLRVNIWCPPVILQRAGESTPSEPKTDLMNVIIP